MQLWTLISRVTAAQSAGIGVGDLTVLGVPRAIVARSFIQGQFIRFNLYLLDGAINTELISSA